MPVVRELRNRISFKINPGDKANAENAFSGIKRSAGFVLKGIGVLTAAGTAMFTEFEKNQAVTRFFSRTTEEAEQLEKIVNQIRGNPIISNRELQQAKASLAQLTVPLKDIEGILPLLSEVTIARPDLDFNQVVSLVTQFTKTGDIEALEKLGAVGKDTAEAFRLSQLNASTAIKGQRNLFQFMAGQLRNNEKRIRENANAVRGDLGFAFKEVGKEASDFTLKFGKEVAPAVTEATNALRDLLIELNKSESLWAAIAVTVNAIATTIKAARAFLAADEREDETLRKEQGGVIRARGGNAPIGPVTPTGLPSLEEAREFLKPGSKKGLFTSLFGIDTEPKAKTQEGKQAVTIDGKITVVNESGVEIPQMSADITKQIMGELKDSLRNITAANGGLAGI